MDENGASSYLTSDYEGLSAEFLEQQPAAGDLRRVAMELAAALAYIHQQQVVLLVRYHRAARPFGAYRSRCLQPLCAALCLHSRLGRQSHLYLRVVLSATYPCGGECRQSRLRQSRRLQRHHRDPHQRPALGQLHGTHPAQRPQPCVPRRGGPLHRLCRLRCFLHIECQWF